MTRPTSAQELWIQEPASGEFAPAVAVLPTAEGLPARLTGSQQTILQNLEAKLLEITGLLTDGDGQSFAELQAALGILMAQNTSVAVTVRDRIEQIKALLTGSGSTSIATRTDSIASSAESILEFLGTQAVATIPGTGTQGNLNNSDPVLDAVAGDSSSNVIAIPVGAAKIGLQAYFSGNTATATLGVELRRVASAVNLSDRRVKYFDIAAGSVALALNNYAADLVDFIPDGGLEMVVHLRSLSTGNCTVYAHEVS